MTPNQTKADDVVENKMAEFKKEFLQNRSDCTWETYPLAADVLDWLHAALIESIADAKQEEDYHKRAALHALGLMYLQYCSDDGHKCMSAGQNAQIVLEYHGLLDADNEGRGEVDWDKLQTRSDVTK